MKAMPSASAALLAAAFAAAPVPAQTGERITRVIVYGNDSCPRGTGDEVVICGRRPENQRFRIPEELRGDAAGPDPESESWAARATSLEYVGRTGTQSCSTVGGGGFTGCMSQLINQARAERRNAGDVNWTRMVEEARQEREARLRAATEEEEAVEQNRPD